jgi:hypothetical protein
VPSASTVNPWLFDNATNIVIPSECRDWCSLGVLFARNLKHEGRA